MIIMLSITKQNLEIHFSPFAFPNLHWLEQYGVNFPTKNKTLVVRTYGRIY